MRKILYLMILVFGLSVSSWAQADEEIVAKPQKENWKKREVFEDFFFNALKEKAIGNYDKAIDNLEKCKTLDDSDFALDYEISLNYKYLKDYENAIFHGEKALAKAPNEKWIMYHLQTLYGLKYDYQNRAKMLGKLVDSMPDLRFLYASTLMNIRKYKEALAQINIIEKKQVLRPSQIGFAISILERLNDNTSYKSWLEMHYKKYPNEHFYARQLLKFYQNKGYDEEATAFEKELLAKGIIKAKATKPTSTLGIIAALKNKYEEQKEYKVLKELLLLLADSKDWNTLDNYAQNGEEVFPNQPLIYLMHGVALNSNKQYKKAAKTLETGLDFVIENPKIEQDFYKQLLLAYQGSGNTKAAKNIQKQLK